MDRNPYSRFQARELTLNDHLAIDRTILSNERTLLAVARTALAMIVIGGTCIKFFESWYMNAIGIVFIVGSILVSLWGWRRFRRTAHRLAVALERRTGAPEHPLKDKS